MGNRAVLSQESSGDGQICVLTLVAILGLKQKNNSRNGRVRRRVSAHLLIIYLNSSDRSQGVFYH